MGEKTAKLYESENMLDINRQTNPSIIRCSPIPTAPVIEVTSILFKLISSNFNYIN